MSTTRCENKSIHWDFKGRQERTGQHRKMLLCRRLYLIAGQSDSKVENKALKRKENSFQDSCQRPQFLSCYHSLSTFWCRNLNLLPFR
eukprot:2917082-Lingulodinium_polyedra.AAC.2